MARSNSPGQAHSAQPRGERCQAFNAQTPWITEVYPGRTTLGIPLACAKGPPYATEHPPKLGEHSEAKANLMQLSATRFFKEPYLNLSLVVEARLRPAPWFMPRPQTSTWGSNNSRIAIDHTTLLSARPLALESPIRVTSDESRRIQAPGMNPAKAPSRGPVTSQSSEELPRASNYARSERGSYAFSRAREARTRDVCATAETATHTDESAKIWILQPMKESSANREKIEPHQAQTRYTGYHG